MNESPLRAREDVEEAFGAQLDFLRASATRYDDGVLSEAKRLAAVVYILLHDDERRGKRQSLSILSQLGIRTKIKYLSTAKPKRMMPGMPLIGIKMADDPEYIPTCQLPGFSMDMWPWKQVLGFHHWWDESVFFAPADQTFSRKNLVFALRSQDGGAHFDQHWGNPLYHLLATTNDPRVKFGLPDDQRHIPNAHLATMRQITWELQESLRAFALIGQTHLSQV